MISEHSLERLEFDKVLQAASMPARSEATASAILGLRPGAAPHEIERRQAEISETRRLRAEGRGLGLAPFEDIYALVRQAQPSGAILEPADLARFIPVLSITGRLSLLQAELAGYTVLPDMISLFTGFPELLRVLKKTVDPEGAILDSASPELASVRREIRRSEAAIQRRLSEIVRAENVAIFLQDTFITKRGGRWVIPVRMDAKGQVPGVLHDVSKSGETAFVEPLEIIHLSNELENLVAEGKAEEIRVLKALTAIVREHSEGLLSECEALVHLDMIDCLGVYADRLGMEMPSINSEGAIRLVRARHPLLAASFAGSTPPRSVVPLDVSLGGDRTVMVITGSNAGGKTVAIKTIGLLVAMGLCGMPIPADSSSTIPLTRDLLIDMGDEQSIEESQSTFSAHITNISRILGSAGTGVMVLIDELGTGTDPDEGAAIACAVLEELRTAGALVFATTHLTGIKGFVQNTRAMVNASMEFDRATLSPLYSLKVGEPGRSHAIEIARRYGLPEGVVNAARALMSGVKVEFERLIDEVDGKRREYERLLAGLTERLEAVAEREQAIERSRKETETSCRALLEKAHEEALALVTDARRAMSAQLDALKRADRESLKKGVREADRKAAELAARAASLVPPSEPVVLSSLKAGDRVHVKSLGYDAVVDEVFPNSGRLRVRAGNIEIEVGTPDIAPAKGKVVFHSEERRHKEPQGDRAVPSSLHLIGRRVEEALSLLEPFLNHAALAGIREVVIIHGVGKGLLSRAVREHLTGHSLVKGFRKGAQSEGGDGVTIAALNIG